VLRSACRLQGLPPAREAGWAVAALEAAQKLGCKGQALEDELREARRMLSERGSK
jgi:hypothetical protein